MAKFTVYFKEKAISSKIYDSGVLHVGRDETNDIIVDSLAMAPCHAAVIIKDSGCIIKQLNDEYPLIINNQPIKEHMLVDNDRINIGKHTIIFAVNSESFLESPAKIVDDNEPEPLAGEAVDQQAEDAARTHEANLQIMNGRHIGRIMTLKKTLNRIGNSESGIAVVARRKEGYYISALENGEKMMINNNPLGDSSIKLENNDIIQIDKTSMQFFA